MSVSTPSEQVSSSDLSGGRELDDASNRQQSPGRPTKKAVADAALGRMSLGERLLLKLSKHPHDVEVVSDYGQPDDRWNLDNALSNFEEAFPGFRDAVKGKRVLDYGCGDGFQAVALAQAGADEVVGVEVSQARLRNAVKLAESAQCKNVEFSESFEGRFDAVISLDAIEHFVKPEENLREMAAALAPGGRIYATFGPLWLAPFGHHMHFFTPAPWINIVFSERTVYRIRSLYRTDGYTTYSPDLNQMTVKKFESLVEKCGLRFEHRRYRTIKDLPVVSRLPLARELFVNQVDAVLVPA